MEVGALGSFDSHEERYFDRLDEQVERLLVSIDAAVNALGMLLDLQLNERAYLLSVLATNSCRSRSSPVLRHELGWMVDQISTQLAFWLLGFVVPIAAGVVAWFLVVRRFLAGDGRKITKNG